MLSVDTLSNLGWNLTTLSIAGSQQKPLPTLTFTKPAASYQMVQPKVHMVIYANRKQTFLVNCGWSKEKNEAVGLIGGGLKAVNMYHSTNMKDSSVRYLPPKMGEHLLPLALCSALQVKGWRLCSQTVGDYGVFMMIFELASSQARSAAPGASPAPGVSPRVDSMYPAPPKYELMMGSYQSEAPTAPTYEDSDEDIAPSAPEGEILSVDDFIPGQPKQGEGEIVSKPEGEGQTNK